jgi:hypothetical protein
VNALRGVYVMKENSMQKQKLFRLVFGLALFMAACASKLLAEPAKISPTNTAEKFIDLKSVNVKDVPPPGCPVTLPTEPAFEAPEPYFATAPWPGIFWFGAEHLWTALDTNGVWEDLSKNPDGYTQKIMWWSSLFSLKDELEPALVVFGRRLDAEAPALRFYGATNAMADDIGEAMLTGVDFPTEGCWEVTGQYKKTGLTFVVWIAP